jgi:hypothetical protein
MPVKSLKLKDFRKKNCWSKIDIKDCAKSNLTSIFYQRDYEYIPVYKGSINVSL